MITDSLLKERLIPLGYQEDVSTENLSFVYLVKNKDFKEIYAFSNIMIVKDEYNVLIQGLNLPLIEIAIKHQVIKIESEEEFEALKVTLFEGDLEELSRLDIILPFLHQQINALEEYDSVDEEYLAALRNLKLMEAAANQIE